MTQNHAKQIARLLNDRNELTRLFNTKSILEAAKNFVFLTTKDGLVLACAECKKVQWYQWEICHVSVKAGEEGKGYGKAVLKLAEEKAIEGNARVLQCTVRINNSRSKNLFESYGYLATCVFKNVTTKNRVSVYQKVVSK